MAEEKIDYSGLLQRIDGQLKDIESSSMDKWIALEADILSMEWQGDIDKEIWQLLNY